VNKKSLLVAALASLALAGLAGADGADHQILKGSAAVKWGPPPPMLQPGAKFAVIDGDPGAKGNVTVRLMLPAGYKIAPHWHPTDEHVTVLAGELSIGMGDTLDESKGVTMRAGGYGVAPANMHPYAWSKSGATIQIHLMGPFALTYVNPADEPSPKK
jgi:mannose-6-phosphate isomerase-like protein (cupin superfamily)